MTQQPGREKDRRKTHQPGREDKAKQGLFPCLAATEMMVPDCSSDIHLWFNEHAHKN